MPLTPIVKFQATATNGGCLHHHVRMVGVAVCPYCEAPSLEELERRKRFVELGIVLGIVFVWLVVLTVRAFW